MKLFPSTWILLTSCIICNVTVLLAHVHSSNYEHSPTQGCVQCNVVPEKHGIDIVPIISIQSDECPRNTSATIIATIIATVPETGQSAECEVFIDKIHRLHLGKYGSISVVPLTLYAAKCCSVSFDLMTNIKLDESYYLYTSDTLKKQKIHIPKQQYHFTLNTYQELKRLRILIQQDGTLYTTHSIEYGKGMVADKSADAYAVENTAAAGLVKNKRYTIRLNAYTPLRDDWTNNEEYLVQLTLYDNHDNAMCVKDTQLMSLKAWQHEYSCFPHFTFAEHKMEMGVGTRKTAKTLYLQWVTQTASDRDDDAFECFIKSADVRWVTQMSGSADVVSVVNNNHLLAKRLGSSLITGKLTDPMQRVYLIHPNGFNDRSGFTMEMASYWIIDGLENDNHILSFRLYVDDVSVECQATDANIVELPAIPRPNDMKKKENENVYMISLTCAFIIVAIAWIFGYGIYYYYMVKESKMKNENYAVLDMVAIDTNVAQNNDDGDILCMMKTAANTQPQQNTSGSSAFEFDLDGDDPQTQTQTGASATGGGGGGSSALGFDLSGGVAQQTQVRQL
eukprot:309218_1